MIFKRLPLIFVLLLSACAQAASPAVQPTGTSLVLPSPTAASVFSRETPTLLQTQPAPSPVPTGTPAAPAKPSSRSLEGMSSEVRAISFSTQKPWLASLNTDKQAIWIWDYTTGEIVRKMDEVAPGESEQVLAFQPGSDLIVAGAGKGIITLWDASAGAPVRQFKGPADIWLENVAFSPDGKNLAANFYRDIWVWDAASGELVNTIKTDLGEQRISSLAYSPDGKLLAIGMKSGALILWDLAKNAAQSTLAVEGTASGMNDVSRLSFSPDGSLLTAQILGTAVEVWDTGSWKKRTSIAGWGSAFSPDGKTLAVMDGEKTVSLWDLGSMAKIGVLPFPSGRENMSDWHKGLYYSPDGSLIASGGPGSTVLVHDAKDFEPVKSVQTAPTLPASDLSYVFPQPLEAGKPISLNSLHMFDNQNGWGIAKDGAFQGAFPMMRVVRTSDGGQTWDAVAQPGDSDTLLEDYFALDAKTAWAAPRYLLGKDDKTGQFIAYDNMVTWRTTDGGQTWQESRPFSLARENLTDTVPSAEGQLQFLDAKNGWLLVNVDCQIASECGWQLYQTSDGGMSWERVSDSENQATQTRYLNSVVFWDRTNGWGTGDSFHSTSNRTNDIGVTRDGGKTWEHVPLPKISDLSGAANLPEVFKQPGVVCTSEGINKVKPAAAGVWNKCPVSYPPLQFYYFTPDRGRTWRGWDSTGSESFINATTGWRLANGGKGQPARLLKTTDGGATWKEISTVAWSGKLYFISNKIGWAVATQSEATALLVTSDGGTTWVEIKPLVSAGQ